MLGNTERKTWPAFDGLRAIAVLMVMVFHFDNPRLLSSGQVGVDVFFVLSGFLITHLLLVEYDRIGRLDLRSFYTRRALRLLPALAVVIAVAVVVVLADHDLASQRRPTLEWIPAAVFYAGNWAEAFSPKGIGLLSHTWSLAVEEQFYLVWPAVLLIVLRRFRSRSHIGIALIGLALTVMVYRAILFPLGGWPYRRVYAIDMHADGLLLGCGVAFLLSAGVLNGHRVAKSLRLLAPVAGLVLVVLAETAGRAGDYAMEEFGIAASGLCTAVILSNQVAAPVHVMRALLEWRPLLWIGRRSYGLYLWHYIVYAAVNAAQMGGSHARIVHNLVEFSISFPVAAVSYRYVEVPWLRRKQRFEVVAPTAAVTGQPVR